MKKIKLVGFIMLVILVLMVGCTPNEEAPPEDNSSEELPQEATKDIEGSDQIISMAEEFIEQLNDGDYEEARENFDDAMIEAIDAEGLEELWTELENEFGNFLGQEYDSIAEADGYRSVFIIGTFNDRDVTFQVVFNENNEISGFFLV